MVRMPTAIDGRTSQEGTLLMSTQGAPSRVNSMDETVLEQDTAGHGSFNDNETVPEQSQT